MGEFIYLPSHDFDRVDSFSYIANCTDGDSYVGVATIHVLPVNDAPYAVDDEAVVEKDEESVCIRVLRNDYEVDSEIAPASLRIESEPKHGFVSIH